MPDYNVKVVVDVQGKKVMDELAKGTGDKSKSLGGAIGSATADVTKGKDIGSVFETLTKAITPLTAVLGVGVGLLAIAVGNSKVLNSVLGIMGKMLGFLVDIILLPLMPFFIQLVNFMYQMILAFRGFTKNLSGQGAIAFLVSMALLGPAGWLTSLVIAWLASPNSPLKGTLNFTIGILQGIGGWLWSVGQWIWGAGGKVVNNAISVLINIGSAMTGFLSGIASLGSTILQWIFGLVTPQNTSLTINFIANLVGDAWTTLSNLAHAGVSFISNGLSQLGLNLPSLDSGGAVMQTGVAVVHKGETYSGVNGNVNTGGGGNTYNFYYQGTFKSDSDLFNWFMQQMRQQGRGLKL
ncbi:hypothetical protein [Methanoregula sp.]|uniref:hypothetical protein n=1 Tax=Methanoregula sp. TaxID=2052170 RepID=UPI003C33672F